jgi:signal transduction histidine kinase
MNENPIDRPNQKNDHKILVVDDEIGIRQGCSRVLRSQGHIVLLAENGEKGLEILRQQLDIDLVLVDLRMPGISGFDFLLQAQKMAPETVFVMITAYATLEAAVEATKLGAYDFIAKPFAPNNLLLLVDRALERVHLIRERNRLEAERRENMLELATEKSQFHTVIDCMAEGVLVCNAEQLLVLFNPAALKILSQVKSFKVPLPVCEVITSEALVNMISQSATQKKWLSDEINISLDAKEKWVLANVAPVIDSASNQLRGTVTVLRDITDLKKIEDVKAKFVNLVAHELRAPLTAIDAYLSVLDEGYVKDKDKQHEIISRSKQRIGALVELVNDLLNIASIEEGTVRREMEPQPIGSILNEVIEIMAQLAKKNQIQLEVHVSDGLPNLQADREELIRLFNNLISNAIKYNKKDGKVSITAEQDDPYVKISVADTGIGITKAGLERLFSEFYREKRDETRLVSGTGLGLHIVKNIVDFYNGRIEVQSEPNKGSTFVVRLPYQRVLI